jgi:anti-sigma-K factor RskA
MSCEARRDAIFLFAADALDASESSELRSHLASGCPPCLGMLAEAQAALAKLAQDVEPVRPPESARDALAARAAADGRGPVLATRAAPPSRSRESLGWRSALAASAAALVAAALVAFVTQLRVAGVEHDSQVRHAALDVIASPYTRIVELSGPALGSLGRGRIYWDYHSGGCFLRATSVERLAPGKVYVLWFTDADGAPLRAGKLEVSSDGEAMLLTEMPTSIDMSGDVSVTIEGDAGAERPSANPVLRGELHL